MPSPEPPPAVPSPAERARARRARRREQSLRAGIATVRTMREELHIRRASRAARRLSVRERGLWAWFIPESRRSTIAALCGLLAYIALRPLPGFELLREGNSELPTSTALAVTGTLFITFTTLYSLIGAGLLHWVRSRMGRTELLVHSRLDRARRSVRWYRWVQGRAGARSDSVQMLATCAIAVLVLLTRPPSLPVAIPLVATAVAVVAAWISSVVGFATEYAAEDSAGTALDMPGIPAAQREHEEYLDLAVLVQTTAGPPGVAALTRSARRAIRAQSVLAHVMSTVIISLVVSVVLTSLT